MLVIKKEGNKKDTRSSISARVTASSKERVSLVQDSMDFILKINGVNKCMTFTDALEHVIELVLSDDKVILQIDEESFTPKQLIVKYLQYGVKEFTESLKNPEKHEELLGYMNTELAEQLYDAIDEYNDFCDTKNEEEGNFDEEEVDNSPKLEEIKAQLTYAFQKFKGVCEESGVEYHEEAIDRFKGEVLRHFHLDNCIYNKKELMVYVEGLDFAVEKLNRLIELYLLKQSYEGTIQGNQNAYNGELESFLQGDYDIKMKCIFAQ